ncbi:hypothetical protein [Curtobacterium flaccumfaciens]|uniref:hypothetical protein n=1 Tax=Curtobacterium flaccumfaciens TaxID=2035 RepID=UPI001ADA833C|nr:hypothetical protein [Curtobacterium flaccumfaciens]MBO9049518.1 hypothetical protein [Curtobacterium flaccumfaciens pv. flaccumfaciens]
MTIIGRNRSTQSEFPVRVTTNVPYVVIRHLALERSGRRPGIDIVITLEYDTGADEPPTQIGLLAVVGATLTDPVTRTDLHPRVYDEWGPVPWSTRLVTLRIAAPLPAYYWDAPTDAEADLHITARRDPRSVHPNGHRPHA